MQAEPIVFVIDEDTATCQAIYRLVGMMNLRCEIFASGQDFLDRFDAGQCGCVVTELKVPGIGGLQIQQRLAAEQRVDIPIIFLTAHATLSVAVRAMRAGAFHFFEKPASEQGLWDAIQEAVLLDRERRNAIQREKEIRARLDLLTIKEEQVLRMIADGKTNRAIAKELDVSIRTVEVRRVALVRKLQVKSPENLLQFAMVACHGNGHAKGDSVQAIRGNSPVRSVREFCGAIAR